MQFSKNYQAGDNSKLTFAQAVEFIKTNPGDTGESVAHKLAAKGFRKRSGAKPCPSFVSAVRREFLDERRYKKSTPVRTRRAVTKNVAKELDNWADVLTEIGASNMDTKYRNQLMRLVAKQITSL